MLSPGGVEGATRRMPAITKQEILAKQPRKNREGARVLDVIETDIEEREPVEFGEIKEPKQSKAEREIFKQTRYENLSPKEQKELTEIGLTIMQGILDGVRDYTVFASTSLYLHEQKYQFGEFEDAPGDFDCAVQSMSSLKAIRSRLGNVPGVEFDEGGRFHRFPTDEARRLSGKIHVGMRTADGIKKVPYEFEFFCNSFIIPKDPTEYQANIHGLKMLNLEGLERQYEKNLSFEGRVFGSAEHVVKFLLQDTTESQLRPAVEAIVAYQREQDTAKAEKRAPRITEADVQIDADIMEIIHRLDIVPKDLIKLYELRDYRVAQREQQMEEPDPYDDAEELRNLSEQRKFEIKLTRDLSAVVSGFKTKLLKRIRNLEKIRHLRKITLDRDGFQSEIQTALTNEKE